MSEGMPGLVPREPSRSPCLGDDDKRRYNGQCNPYACRLSALGPACDRKRQMAGTLDEPTFRCPICKQEKGRHEFDTSPKNHARSAHCTACREETVRQRDDRDREWNREYARKYRERQKEQGESDGTHGS